MQMMNGTVAIHIKGIPRQRLLTAQWDDDAKISSIIHELNYGKYKEETL